MNELNSLTSMIPKLTDGLAKLVGVITNPSLMEMIPLEAAEDNRTICLKDGTLASMINIGSTNVTHTDVSSTEFLPKLKYCFLPFLKHGQHSFEVTYVRSPEALRETLKGNMEIRRKRCLKRGLNLDDFLQEQFRLQCEELAQETVLLTLYTWSSLLKGGKQNRNHEARHMDPLRQGNNSYEKHLSLVDCLARDLSSRGFEINLLDVKQYLYQVRLGLYPNLFRVPEISGTRLQGTLDWELAREDVHILDQNLVLLGDNAFGGFDVSLFPEFTSSFNDLIQAVSDTHPEIPFRCSFKFDGLKPNTMKVKEQYVKFFGFTNPVRHRNIRSAFEMMKDVTVPEDLIRLRIGFSTWADNGEIKKLRQYLSFLRRTVEQWGNISTDRITGDPVATILCTVPGFGPISTAPEVLVPMGESLNLFPLARQASPWLMGEIMFRTADGVCWPYQRGSALQNSWIEILIGSSGTGKSVAMNALNLGSVLAGSSMEINREELPKMVIVDVGNSSKGLIRILQEALPAGRKNEAAHVEFKLLPENAINPFDTPLGFRKPLNNHRQFLINFISILANDTSLNTTIDLDGFLGLLIEKTYEHYSDWGSPKRYYPGEDEIIDHLLEKTGFSVNDHSTWWEVTDWLFEQGYPKEANLAQTQAVPILTDLIQVLHFPHFTNLTYHEDDSTERGIVDLTSHLQIRFSEAVRDFPIIAHPTRFDLGEARVMAIDVAEVLNQTRDTGSQRCSSLMFMLARHVAIRNWEVDEGEILSLIEKEDIPDKYSGYHLQRARTDKGQSKFFCIDEYHRASSVKEINNQLIRDAREGRKRNFRITLASQFVNDFNSEFLNLASTVLVFGNQLPREVRGIRKWFPLTKVSEDILLQELTGPMTEGSPLLGIFRTKEGTIIQKLYLKLCSDELWEFSTTSEDALLRGLVYETFGVTDGRKKLCRRFPAGTAKDKLLNMKHWENNGQGGYKGTGNSTITDKIIKELYTINTT